jgi:hypothetical protein
MPSMSEEQSTRDPIKAKLAAAALQQQEIEKLREAHVKYEKRVSKWTTVGNVGFAASILSMLVGFATRKLPRTRLVVEAGGLITMIVGIIGKLWNRDNQAIATNKSLKSLQEISIDHPSANLAAAELLTQNPAKSWEKTVIEQTAVAEAGQMQTSRM